MRQAIFLSFLSQPPTAAESTLSLNGLELIGLTRLPGSPDVIPKKALPLLILLTTAISPSEIEDGIKTNAHALRWPYDAATIYCHRPGKAHAMPTMIGCSL